MEAEMPIQDNTGKLARGDAERANVFAAHLQKIFQPIPPSNGFTLPHVFDGQPTDPLNFPPNEIEKVIKQ